MPALSVITVCYNAGATLLDAVRSVVEPKTSSVEYIVVDGASSDGSLALLEPYRGRIDTLISEPDRGIYDAMNKGLALARGDFVAFMNADDAYLPSSLASMLGAIRSRGGEFDVLYGDWIGITGNGTPTRREANHEFGARHRLCHQAMAVRRELMLDMGGFDAKFGLCADLDLIFRLRASGARFFHLPEELVRFSEAGASNTRVRQAAWESIEIARRHAGLLRSLPFALLMLLHLVRVSLPSATRT